MGVGRGVYSLFKLDLISRDNAVEFLKNNFSLKVDTDFYLIPNFLVEHQSCQ